MIKLKFIRHHLSSSSPINHKIPFKFVNLQQNDGSIIKNTQLSTILASINKSTHLIRLTQHQPPTVRILSLLQDHTNNLERKANLKANSTNKKIVTKQLRLSWLTSGADFDHKLAQARKDLERGNLRLDILFSPKQPGARAPSRIEMTQHMQNVANKFTDVSNQWKDNAFLGKGQAKLFLQSTVRIPKQLPDRNDLEEKAKKSLQKREKSRIIYGQL